MPELKFAEPSTATGVKQAVLDKYAGRKLPVVIRNNNMGAVSITGDIAKSWAAKQPGFVGTSPRPANEGGYYAKFATPEYGVFASSNLLIAYGRKGWNTPLKIVSHWSADGKAWNSYAQRLVTYLREAGFDVNPDSAVDLNDAAVRTAILKAKSSFESGANTPVYVDSVFANGVRGIFPGGIVAEETKPAVSSAVSGLAVFAVTIFIVIAFIVYKVFLGG